MIEELQLYFIVNLNFFMGVDPETQQILFKVEQILFPIIYAVAGLSLIFAGVKYGFKMYNEPEERAKHIKNMVWSFLGILLVFLAAGAGHIILAKYLNLI